ncbi:hypothetical protein ACSZND_00040 [Aeromonas hydrophila]|uniref:hypothetical protein n=1 Tax=Aeromonas TaxID=642 RepID=UPI00111BB41D|nr:MULTISPECIES: hypothetical protein [Aeromonas]MCX4103549.1 hypothetical protein [Aeromonas hydrophila]TNJ17220.1 hypothetical protein CF112_19700 [Aeromonas hydrophila]
MGKGGSGKVEETAAQKALAEVAMQQWQLYQNELKPYEDLFMNKVDDLKREEEFDKLAGTAALGTAQSFGEARQGLADGMAAAGVDPSSGKYQEAMKALEADQALSQTDTANRAQSSQQDRYVAGLKDVVSMGQGQKAEALAGYNSLASTSLNKAAMDAQSKFNNKQAVMGLAGALGGAATAYGMNSAVTTASKKISPTASVLQGKGY